MSRRAGQTGHGDDPMLKVALELEKIALSEPVLHRPQVLSERRFLFGHHAEGDGLPNLDVHGSAPCSDPRRQLISQSNEVSGPAAELGDAARGCAASARRDYVAMDKRKSF